MPLAPPQLVMEGDCQAGDWCSTAFHACKSMTTPLVPEGPAPGPGNKVRAGDGLRAWWAHHVIYWLQDTPHVVLRHHQAQLLVGLPQGGVHHVLVSRVTLAAWKTKQVSTAWFLGCWDHGGARMAAVAEGRWPT